MSLEKALELLVYYRLRGAKHILYALRDVLEIELEQKNERPIDVADKYGVPKTTIQTLRTRLAEELGVLYPTEATLKTIYFLVEFVLKQDIKPIIRIEINPEKLSLKTYCNICNQPLNDPGKHIRRYHMDLISRYARILAKKLEIIEKEVG